MKQEENSISFFNTHTLNTHTHTLLMQLMSTTKNVLYILLQIAPQMKWNSPFCIFFFLTKKKHLYICIVLSVYYNDKEKKATKKKQNADAFWVEWKFIIIIIMEKGMEKEYED